MSLEEKRKAWMSVLAKAPAEALGEAFGRLGPVPAFSWLRPPESGAIMVRGRQGGTGAPFNLGEMTVTRCALKLDDGTVGHAYIPGRDAVQAQRAALCDALLQGGRAADVHALVVEPLAAQMAKARAVTAARAEATRVDFFTMVRGES